MFRPAIACCRSSQKKKLRWMDVFFYVLIVMMKFAAIAMGFSRSPPAYLSLMATAANSSSEVPRKNMTMAAAAAAYTTGANFASGGSGLLDSTVYLFHLTLLLPCFWDLILPLNRYFWWHMLNIWLDKFAVNLFSLSRKLLANSVLRKKKAFSKCRLRLPLWYTSCIINVWRWLETLFGR